jgi:hypothetical protein
MRETNERSSNRDNEQSQPPHEYKRVGCRFFLDKLKERNVPMLSVNERLQFVEARRAISLHQVTYDPLTRIGAFSIVCPMSIKGVTFAIPLQRHAFASLKVSMSETISYPPVTAQVINGTPYAVFRTELQPNQPTRVSYRFE